jgi:hypothetical protein
MTTATHRHHWKIEEPNGPTTEGRCACGESKVFPAAFVGDRPSSGNRTEQLTARRLKSKFPPSPPPDKTWPYEVFK